MAAEEADRDTPNVSVVVPSFRGAALLPKLLEAFRAQRTGLSWELIVVLDGTPDDSREAIRELGYDLPVRVVEFPTNRGRPAALNAGFSVAQGEVLVRCDDDLLPEPNYIERHAQWHAGRSTVGAVGLYRNVFGPGRYAEVYGLTGDQQFRAGAYARPPEEAWLYWAGNCSVHRSMWERVGPYDECYTFYGEDAEWGRRLIAAGARIVLDPELEVRHTRPVASSAVRCERSFLAQGVTAEIESAHGDLSMTYPSGLKDRLWSALVRLGARGSDARRYRRRGKRIDALLPFLPKSLAGRLVAWGLESAGLAGRRSVETGTFRAGLPALSSPSPEAVPGADRRPAVGGKA